MTRASVNRKLNPWAADAAPARAIVPICRVVNPTTFGMKNGGYVRFYRLPGRDPEGMTDAAMDALAHTYEGARHGLPEGSGVMEFMVLRAGCELPREQAYENPVAESFVQARIEHLDRTAGFRRVELYWALTMEPRWPNRFRLNPREQDRENNRLLAELAKASAALEDQLGEALGLRLLPVEEAFSFLSYLFNQEDWAERVRLRGDMPVDVQIAASAVKWHPDHLSIGRKPAMLFSLTMTPDASRPCLFSPLAELDCDAVLCTGWRPRPSATARKEAEAQERFQDFFKVGLAARALAGRDFASLDEGAKGQAARKRVSRIGELLERLDEKAEGEYFLKLLISGRDLDELKAVVPAVHTAFVTARAPVIEESDGCLSAFYAMFPGNGDFNVYPLWLGEDHSARLASVYAPTVGHRHSEALDREYVNVYETRTGTPYFKDPYVDGMRAQLIVGPPRQGKSVHVNQEIATGQKYGGWDFIFDIGRSYESVVGLYGGKVDRVGLDGPRVNPFALEPTDANLKFLHGFIKLLLTSGGAAISPEENDDIYATVRNMYNLRDPALRRLRNLMLPPQLQRYMTKWVGDGVYARIFDNAEDSLRLNRLQCWDFEGVREQYADLIEPLMVWLLGRIDAVIHDPANLGVPKHVVIEELFAAMKNKQLLEGMLTSIKQVGKYLGGVTLVAQSVRDLGDHAESIVNACSSFLFLRDPGFNRQHYRDLFGMNEQQLALFASLGSREALYIRRDGETKVLILNLDPRSYAAFTTKPKDRVRRDKLVARYGIDAGLDRFAAGEGLELAVSTGVAE